MVGLPHRRRSCAQTPGRGGERSLAPGPAKGCAPIRHAPGVPSTALPDATATGCAFWNRVSKNSPLPIDSSVSRQPRLSSSNRLRRGASERSGGWSFTGNLLFASRTQLPICRTTDGRKDNPNQCKPTGSGSKPDGANRTPERPAVPSPRGRRSVLPQVPADDQPKAAASSPESPMQIVHPPDSLQNIHSNAGRQPLVRGIPRESRPVGRRPGSFVEPWGFSLVAGWRSTRGFLTSVAAPVASAASADAG